MFYGTFVILENQTLLNPPRIHPYMLRVYVTLLHITNLQHYMADITVHFNFLVNGQLEVCILTKQIYVFPVYLVETRLQISIVSCFWERYSCGFNAIHQLGIQMHAHPPKQHTNTIQIRHICTNRNTLTPPCSFIIQIKLNVFRIYRIGMCLFDGFCLVPRLQCQRNIDSEWTIFGKGGGGHERDRVQTVIGGALIVNGFKLFFGLYRFVITCFLPCWFCICMFDRDRMTKALFTQMQSWLFFLRFVIYNGGFPSKSDITDLPRCSNVVAVVAVKIKIN